MPKTEKVYPDWIQKHRTQGMTVKKKGDAYYLYKRTSKRVPGKKYPQPVDTYVGIITPDGIVETQRKRVKLTDIEVREFGYSNVLWEICPREWKEAVGDEWEDLLKSIIIKRSPMSYLGKDYEPREAEEFRCSFGAQAGMLDRRICRAYKVNVKELEILKSIYLVYIGKEEAVSRVDDAQRELLDKVGVRLWS